MAPSSIIKTLQAVITLQALQETKRFDNSVHVLPTTVTVQDRPLDIPLHLNWSTNGIIINIQLSVTTEELLKELHLYCLKISLHVKDDQGAGEKELLLHTFDNDLVLSNINQYKCAIVARTRRQRCIDIGSDISVELKVILLECKFNTITDVSVPPCSHNLGTLLAFTTTEQFTDVKIIATAKSESPAHFFAHKVILAAKSPVFEKMFEHDLQESATNSITVEDIEPEVLKEMLTYIYTNQVPNIKDMATSLLYAAEKYQLEGLKAMCEQFLSYNLQVSNAPQTLLLAQTHNACQLKNNALKFIVTHIDKVRESNDWEMVKHNCELMDVIVGMMAEPAAKRRCDLASILHAHMTVY